MGFMKLDDEALKTKMTEQNKALEAAHKVKEDAKNAKVNTINAEGLSSMNIVWKDRYPPPPPPPPEEEDMGEEGEEGMDGEDPDGADGDDGEEPPEGRSDEL